MILPYLTGHNILKLRLTNTHFADVFQARNLPNEKYGERKVLQKEIVFRNPPNQIVGIAKAVTIQKSEVLEMIYLNHC